MVASTEVLTEVVQQQPIQQAFVDDLGEFEWDEDVPEFNVLGCGVQKGWMLGLLRERRLMWNSAEGHEFVRNSRIVLKILPPIQDYPAGIQITQNEWSLGLMHWQNLALEEVRYYRNVNGNFVPIVMTQENWLIQDVFYNKVLRVQLRSREMERSAVGLNCIPNWIVS